MTNLDSMLKSRAITLPTKVHIVKATVFFPVVIYRCESWTIKKAEHQRIDTFKLLCWRSLLRLPWTARRPNHSILKEISPEYLLEGWMLKLKLQYFGHLMRRADSLEKTLMLGKTEGEEGDRGCDGWMASLDMNLGKLWEIMKDAIHLVCCSPWGCKELTPLSDRTTTTIHQYVCVYVCMEPIPRNDSVYDTVWFYHTATSDTDIYNHSKKYTIRL